MTRTDMELFHVSAEQRQLALSARDIFAAAMTSDDVWASLGDSSFLGATVDQAHGGLGLSWAELALLTEEAGDLLLPGPVIESLWVGIPALASLSPADGAAELAAAIEGRVVVTVIDRTRRGSHLGQAAFAVVPGEQGDLVVDAGAFGPITAVGTSDPIEVSGRAERLDKTGGRPLQPLGGVGALPLARLGAAAHLNGISRWLLANSVRHASERHQFGVAIGSFQALRHRLADAHVELEFARSVVLSAACDVDEREAGASTAILAASITSRRAFELAHSASLQIHGGMGFTWEHPLHRWLKRGMTIAARFGTRREIEITVGRQLLSAVASQPRQTPPPPHI